MTSDLIAFVLARLDEDEERTRKLLVDAQRTALALKEPRLLGREIPGWHAWPAVEQLCTERLAEVEAKRRILALSDFDAQFPDSAGGYDTACEDVVALLALPYAGHPDYREEWRAAGE